MPLIGMAGSTVMLLPWLAALKSAVALGFEAFELFGEFPQCVCEEVRGAERAEGRTVVKSSGIALAVHAPFTSLNPAALNPGIRKESVRQILAAVDLCADLGGTTVITHNGEYVLSGELRAKAPAAVQIQWQNNIASLRECAHHAAERGVTLCLENIGFEPEHLDRNIDDLLRIKAEVNESALAFCLDIGHARLNNELTRAVTQMGSHIRHIHFTDNFGKHDDHLPIGHGDFDYSPLLDFFRTFPHILTLEVIAVGTDPEPAVQSRARVEKLLAGG